MTEASTMPGRLIEVTEHVYVYEQPPGGWCVNNAGIVVDNDTALVIDTAATEFRARCLRRTVDNVAAGPRRIVVNTHAHGDHTFGNYVFGPAATIIAHPHCREEMARTGLALSELWPETDWGSIELALPNITVADRLALRYGTKSAEVIHVGPAHTAGDLVVWLPEPGILFAGDVLFSSVTPFHLFGSVVRTLAAIDRLRELRPRVVVCGHGPVAGPEVLDENSDYLRWIRQLAEKGKAADRTPLDAARDANLHRFAHWVDPERIVGNLHRAYLDLDGQVPEDAPDYAAILAEMVDFNGGKAPTCHA